MLGSVSSILCKEVASVVRVDEDTVTEYVQGGFELMTLNFQLFS